MNGWLRLWVLFSIIWFSLVMMVSALIFPEPYAQSVWTKYQLSEESKRYFTSDFESRFEPSYQVPILFNDGSKELLQFPILKDDDQLTEVFWRNKLIELANTTGREIEDLQIRKFYAMLKAKNKLAIKAKQELDSLVLTEQTKRERERIDHIKLTALIIVLPMLVILALGFGIAWVRRGFGK